MVETSLIKEIDKDSIDQIILFKHISKNDDELLKQNFDFDGKQIRLIGQGYRDIGLVIELKKQTEGLNFDWSPFVNRVIIKNDIISKLDNVFVNKEFNKILLLTTKRLLKIDLNKLNEKIELINDAIHHYNVKIERERKEIEHELSDIDKII
jgi:hypothetical protein